MIYLGPAIFGFLIGFIVGTRVRITDDINFTMGSYFFIFLLTLIIAWKSGPYPFFNDLPLSTSFLFAAIGLIIGDLVERIITK